jgi:hypothetical protein
MSTGLTDLDGLICLRASVTSESKIEAEKTNSGDKEREGKTFDKIYFILTENV